MGPRDDAGKPIPATPESLLQFFQTPPKPILWVGAGLSIAAGLPSTHKILSRLAEASPDDLDPSADFFEVVDQFVASVGKVPPGESTSRSFRDAPSSHGGSPGNCSSREGGPFRGDRHHELRPSPRDRVRYGWVSTHHPDFGGEPAGFWATAASQDPWKPGGLEKDGTFGKVLSGI